MIIRILTDIRYFVFILAIVLTGFSLAFWLISYPNTSLDFGTIEMSFYNTYLYMLGQNISADFAADTASPRLGIVLLVVFMFFMMILMLNLLIALMGNSYDKVQEKGLAEWRLGQASIVLEQSFMLDKDSKCLHQTMSRIHVLKYTAQLAEESAAADAADSRLAALELSMKEDNAALMAMVSTLMKKGGAGRSGEEEEGMGDGAEDADKAGENEE